MQRKGRDATYTRWVGIALGELADLANLADTTAVEMAIANKKRKVRSPTDHFLWIDSKQPATQAWKLKLCIAYGWHCKAHDIEWKDRPIYHPDEKTIQPPTDEKVHIFIASIKGMLSIKIQLSGETGLRPIEVQGMKGLHVKDIHLDTKTVTPIVTKRCNARPPLSISEELTCRISQYITENNLQADDIIWTTDPKYYGQSFRRARARIAKKLKDPSFKSIRLYDIRHYYITKKLKKIGNVEIVRQFTGHKTLDSLQKYLHMIATDHTEWITESTQDRKRSEELIKLDYQYVLTTPDGYMQFRKPK
jgi:hypothetical protein